MQSKILIHTSSRLPAIEMAERKGLGHPDTVCDEIAEAVSVALCRYYLREFGSILHHNVDKALLVGGSARPAWGGGRVQQPMELFLAGRATMQVGETIVPAEDIAVQTAKDWLRRHFRFVDPGRHVVVVPKIRPGSADLTELFRRFGKGEVPLANDTSFGAGFYPFSALEQKVLAIETLLNAPEIKAKYPFIGEDVKVMGVKNRQSARFTVAIAMVDAFLENIRAYRDGVAAVKTLLREALDLAESAIAINTADNYAAESVYLTVTGTSAESGDDGQVGRGNRINGLITPYRPMSLEATAGKNPVSHVGKIYNIFAQDLSKAICENGWAEAVQVFIVSQIGKPITEPQLLDIRLKRPGADTETIRAFARERLGEMPGMWRKIVG